MHEIEFSCSYVIAHRLLRGGSPKWETPHTHQETVTVRLIGADPAGARDLAARYEAGERLCRDWIDNHVNQSLQLGEGDPMLDYFRRFEPELLGQVMVFPGDPSTDAFVACLRSKFGALMPVEVAPTGALEVSIEMRAKSACASDEAGAAQQALAQGEDHWWCRADMSINDEHIARDDREVIARPRKRQAGKRIIDSLSGLRWRRHKA